MAVGPEKKEDLFHYLRIVIAILALVLVVLLSYFGYRLGRMVFSDEGLTNLRTENRSYTLVVEKGESVLTIGRELQKNNIIENGLAFFIQSKVYSCKVEPGIYNVTSRQSSKEIIKYLNQEYLNIHQKKK